MLHTDKGTSAVSQHHSTNATHSATMSLRTTEQMSTSVLPRPNLAPRSPLIVHDVTVRFSNAASALKTGQLVKQDDFTLFEAVSALEVLDPKMDQGFGEDLEDKYDIPRPLLPEEVIG